MKHSEFKIGDNFYVATAKGVEKFLCTDIGTRTVAGVRVDEVSTNQGILNEEEAHKKGWFDGPPYAIVEHLLDEDDQEACYKTLEEAEEDYDNDDN